MADDTGGLLGFLGRGYDPAAAYGGLLSEPSAQDAMKARALAAMAGAFGRGAMPSPYKGGTPFLATLGQAAEAAYGGQDELIKARNLASESLLRSAQGELARSQVDVNKAQLPGYKSLIDQGVSEGGGGPASATGVAGGPSGVLKAGETYWTPAGLAALRPTEGRYDQIHYPSGDPSTASGAYGFLDRTWKQQAPLAGVDITKYPRAYLAPPEVQDRVAAITPVHHWTGVDDKGKPFNAAAQKLATNPAYVTGTGAGAPAAGTSAPPVGMPRSLLADPMFQVPHYSVFGEAPGTNPPPGPTADAAPPAAQGGVLDEWGAPAPPGYEFILGPNGKPKAMRALPGPGPESLLGPQPGGGPGPLPPTAADAGRGLLGPQIPEAGAGLAQQAGGRPAQFAGPGAADPGAPPPPPPPPSSGGLITGGGARPPIAPVTGPMPGGGLLGGGAPPLPAEPPPAAPPSAPPSLALPAPPNVMPPAGQPPLANASPQQKIAMGIAGLSSLTGHPAPGWIQDLAKMPAQMAMEQYKAWVGAQANMQGEQYKKQLEVAAAQTIATAQAAGKQPYELAQIAAKGQADIATRLAEQGLYAEPLTGHVVAIPGYAPAREANKAAETRAIAAGKSLEVGTAAGWKALEETHAGELAANRRDQQLGQLAEAMQGFTPGATADLRVRGQAILRDLGLIKGDEVPSAETFQRAARQLQLTAAPKGQGSVSNYERELYGQAVESIANTPEGVAKAIDIARRLDQYDRNVAQIHRDVATENRGTPNLIEAQQRIAKLGPPLSAGEINSLEQIRAGKVPSPTPAGGGGTYTHPDGKTYPSRTVPDGKGGYKQQYLKP